MHLKFRGRAQMAWHSQLAFVSKYGVNIYTYVWDPQHIQDFLGGRSSIILSDSHSGLSLQS